MFRRFIASLGLAATLSVSPAALAETAADKLSGLLTGYQSFSAEFEQFIVNNDGRRAQEAYGEMQLAKPDLFYWQTDKPFPQTIVGDGQYIWIYDPDLEQVTRRDAGEGLNNAPALLLNGQVDKLSNDYKIRAIKAGEQEQMFELLPLKDNAGFNRIRLFFTHQQLSELMLEDSLGQRTTILLKNQQRNPALADDHFVFTVPDGTDLIINEGQ